jgi:ubiquinone/menaquinone biosynthesis C-methylase UbiE
MLSHEEARAFYDWFGTRQDGQAFYEDPALSDLLAHTDFGESHSVFEFGCGTGRLAERLLTDRLPSDARYEAIDISSTMVRLAQARLAPWRGRARVTQSSGAMSVPAPNASFDRFIACYVLDLLSASDIRELLAEACRVLAPGGLLCVVGLTRGPSLPAWVVGVLWQALFHLVPKLVGGCRAIAVREFLGDRDWSVRYVSVVTRLGISSEVLVACARTGRSG